MENNQQNQENQLYQPISNQTSESIIISNQSCQLPTNDQINMRQETPTPSDTPSGSLLNNSYTLPNQRLIEKHEELIETKEKIIEGERDNLLNQNQQSNNDYVLPPLIQPPVEKLIIPCTKCAIISIEIFLIISSGLLLGLYPGTYKIYPGIFFLIESILLLYFRNNKLEIIKDVPNKKVRVKLINFFCCERKKYKKEFDLPGIFIDSIAEKIKKKEVFYYKLILINTFKDGISIDLDSSNIINTPVTIFEFYANVKEEKFKDIEVMKQILNSFLGNNNDDNEISPLSFNIKLYMNKSADSYNNFKNFNSSYIKVNEYFFSYYSKNPLKTKPCDGFFTCITIFFNIALIFMTIMTFFGSVNQEEDNKKSKRKRERELSENLKVDEIVIIEFSVWVGLYIISYFIMFLVNTCSEKTTEYLRIDIIYSKNFDRLFLGIVKNDGKTYIKKFLFNLNEIDKFVIIKKNNNEKGFHLKSINKGNNLIQDICYINEEQRELEGLLYILNEKLIGGADKNDDYNIAIYSNVDINNDDCSPSKTPFLFNS